MGVSHTSLPDTPLQKASDAYAAGKYAEAEAIADRLIERAQGLPQERAAGHEALLARRILAHASARQSKFGEARERFEQLRQAAYESPDHGKQRVPLGEAAPTLEEEGAFEEAVCTGAMGDKKAAEAEYNAFLRHYPHSLLVHAAVKRIARFHGGDIPKEAETLWKQAMHLQKAADEAQRRSEARCDPECLAELLRRQRLSASHQPLATSTALAQEMKTSGKGTSLATMAQTAAKHGLKLSGVSLSQKGLARQKLPLLALIMPGHYVLVETLSPSTVTLWDPDAKGVGISGTRTLSLVEWQKVWNGVALK